MRRVKRFTSRMLAIMLAGALTVGNLSVSTFGAETDATVADTSETAVEEVVSEAEDMATEEVTDAEAVTSYTVTLDANGGYFENEWDDVLGQYIEQAEVVNKHIPVGEHVSSYPVYKQRDAVTMFLGWSLERDGEIVWQKKEAVDQSLKEIAGIQELEGYTPMDNCVLCPVCCLELC